MIDKSEPAEHFDSFDEVLTKLRVFSDWTREALIIIFMNSFYMNFIHRSYRDFDEIEF